MAIFHLSAQAIGRKGGRSAVAAAAYRAGERLEDKRTGLAHDYTKKSGVDFSAIVMPSSAGDWKPSRNELWNAAEKANGRADAIIAREFNIALPHELNEVQRNALALDFAKYMAEKYSVASDLAIHSPGSEGDERNWHMHIMATAKRVSGEAFGTKATELDPISCQRNGNVENGVSQLREVWAALANSHLEAAGSTERIDHRTLEEQGKDREATEHLGVTASAMERKGLATDRGDLNREIVTRNGERERLKKEAEEVAGQIIDLAEYRAKKEAEREILVAVRTQDPARVLEKITERRSTFTRADLSFALARDMKDMKARTAFMDELLNLGDVVPLRDEANGPICRYTTRDVLKSENDVLATGRALAADRTHGLTSWQLAGTLDHHHHLDREQRAAFEKATGAEGLAIIAGEAGTGKSRTMAAIRDAYEGAGLHVVGLAWTNAVVQDMRRDGFKDATTLAAEVMRQDAGRSTWGRDTVVIVDEAAMLATKHFAELTKRAEGAGAKLILIGDDKQLASIERGGMFTALKDEHGAAELHHVRRVSDDDQRRAFNMMHRGEYRDALEIFEERGAIHWKQSQDEARAALVEKYIEDSAREPGRTRFAFAYTNADVSALNGDIRAVRKARGELGEDHYLQTKDGLQAFAAGDRVQFTGSARDRESKAQGVVNGMVGTVREIEGKRMTVALDGLQDGQARIVSFSVGDNAEAGEFGAIRHGYAGTIYKGQGKTLDQSYLYHSAHWRAASSYVALTRHREDVAVFVDQSTAKDLDTLAKQMGRVEEKRAASLFHHEQNPPTPEPPRFARRYAALIEAHKQAEDWAEAARGGDEKEKEKERGAGTVGGRGKRGAGGSSARMTYTLVEEAARESLSQRIAARVGKIRNPAKQAEALRKAHEAEAAKNRGADSNQKPNAPHDWFAESVKAADATAKKSEQSSPNKGRTLDRGPRGR